MTHKVQNFIDERWKMLQNTLNISIYKYDRNFILPQVQCLPVFHLLWQPVLVFTFCVTKLTYFPSFHCVILRDFYNNCDACLHVYSWHIFGIKLIVFCGTSNIYVGMFSLIYLHSMRKLLKLATTFGFKLILGFKSHSYQHTLM